jgi:hypothetical protein
MFRLVFIDQAIDERQPHLRRRRGGRKSSGGARQASSRQEVRFGLQRGRSVIPATAKSVLPATYASRTITSNVPSDHPCAIMPMPAHTTSIVATE